MSSLTFNPPVCPICLEPVGIGAIDAHLRWHGWHAVQPQSANLGSYGGGNDDAESRGEGPALQDDARWHEMEAQSRELEGKIRAGEIAAAEARGAALAVERTKRLVGELHDLENPNLLEIMRSALSEIGAATELDVRTYRCWQAALREFLRRLEAL